MGPTDVIDKVSDIESLTAAFQWIIMALTTVIFIMGTVVVHLYNRNQKQRDRLEEEKKSINDDLYKLTVDNLTILKDLKTALNGNNMLIKEIPNDIKQHIDTQTMALTNKIELYGKSPR